MKRFVAIFSLAFFTFISQSQAMRATLAMAPEASAKICGALEGSYLGTIAPLSHGIRINLLCLDGQRVAATLTNSTGPIGTLSFTLTFDVVDGDTLVLANFPIDAADRKNVSANTSLSYMKVSLAALRAGKISGELVNNNLVTPLAIEAKVVQHFATALPKLESEPTFDPQKLVGTYTIQNAGTPMEVYADVIDGAPIFNLNENQFFSIHMIDAPSWNGRGDFIASSPYGNGEPQEAALTQIRGRMVSDHELRR